MSTAHSSAAGPPRPPRPAPRAPRPYHFPRFERRALSNGLPLVVAPVRKLPLVTVLMLMDAGAVADPAGKEGVAQLTARLLLEDDERAGGALAERFERFGASIDAHADWDTAVVSLTAMREHLDEALALFREVVRAPAFPARDVERLKAERLAELLQLRAEPRGLADEYFARAVYEPASRYARPDGGTEASVAALGREDVVAYYQARYRPGGATLIAAGDLTADEAQAAAERVFGDWTGAAPARPATSDAPASGARRVHLVRKPDAAQAEARVGHVGIPRNHPDYFPATVMNAVLGGLFSSRINLNLREAHGYTYGAFSGFDWRRQAGPFYVSTAVKSEVTDRAVREILHEIDRIRDEEIPDDELTLATSYLDGVFPIRYETTDAIAAALSNLVLYGLPEDYFDRYRERVRGVTAADVLRAARTHLRPEALQIVVVGDPAAVAAPLEALGVGPVTAYDVEGTTP